MGKGPLLFVFTWDKISDKWLDFDPTGGESGMCPSDPQWNDQAPLYCDIFITY